MLYKGRVANVLPWLSNLYCAMLKPLFFLMLASPWLITLAVQHLTWYVMKLWISRLGVAALGHWMGHTNRYKLLYIGLVCLVWIPQARHFCQNTNICQRQMSCCCHKCNCEQSKHSFTKALKAWANKYRFSVLQKSKLLAGNSSI